MEPIEHFRLLLSTPSGGGGLMPTLDTSIATAGITTGIVDAAGTLLGATITVTPDSSVGEGDGAATTFTVKVDLDCCTTFDEDTTVTVSLGGTATGTDDYTATIANVTIPASTATGSTTAAVSITPVEDAIVEGDETIVVNGSLTGFVVFPDTITLTDNDTATVGITGPSAVVAEGSNAEFTVTLSKAVAKETTVAWSAPLSTDTATAADLGATSGTVTFAAGSAAGSTQTISIPITDDTEAELAETFTVTLGTVGGDLADLVTLDSAASSATATIAKNDDPAQITLSVNPEYVQEGQNIAQVTVTATRDGTVGDHTIMLSVGGGTATDGADYTIWRFNPALRIAPGETEATLALTFTVVDDKEDEPNETVILSGTASGATVSDAVVTIGQPESIVLSVRPDTIAEYGGATEVTVTATLSAARAADTVVDLTLGGTASDPGDYTATALASITIPKGERSADGTLTITPVDDTEDEGEETITVSGESGARTVSPTDITIADDPTVITLSVDPEYIQEGQLAKRVTLTATRDGTVGDHTINLSVGGGTATDGTDYTIWTFSPAPRIAPGETSTTFTLTFSVNTDNEDEGNETVILSGTTSGAVVRDAVVTIGSPETIALSVDPSTISEGAEATDVTVTATMSAARAADTVVNITLGGTATQGH